MMLALQRYPAKVKHRPEAQQVTADMLSRSPTEIAEEGATPVDQILQIASFLSDLAITNPQEDLPVSKPTYKDIKDAILGDHVLQEFQQLIVKGWPLKPTELPEDVRAFYHVKDELATLDGVIYRGPQLVILKSYRPIILKKLHLSHQGTAATLQRARSCVYWPQMSNDITCRIIQCVACAHDAPSQQKETIQHHDIQQSHGAKSE